MSSTLASVLAGGPGPWHGPGAWWPVFPVLWLILLTAAVVTFVVMARRRSRTVGARAGEARLAELYAAGEITEDEYRQRREILREER
jgi:putative membrane protein